MLYIIYEDANKQRGWSEADTPYSDTFEQDWRQENPHLRLVAILDEGHNLLNRAYNDRRAFNLICSRYGFKPDDYGATIIVNGAAYAFTGFKTRNRKYPCILRPEDSEKRNMKCSPAFVKHRMDASVRTAWTPNI